MPYATADDGINLHYEITGAGEPLVFVPLFAQLLRRAKRGSPSHGNLVEWIDIVYVLLFLFMHLKTGLFEGKLFEEKIFLTEQLELVEKKNELLTDKIDLDYLETVYRKKFMFGISGERIYKSN